MLSEAAGYRPGNMAALSGFLTTKKFKKKDASTTHTRFVIRLKGPRHSFHDPLDSLRVQPLNYVHN